MDARHFDHLARALSEAGTRRGLLGLLATLPVLGGLFALLAPDETEAKGRRKRRKKRHKHGKGNGRKRKGKHKKGKHQNKKQKCNAKSRAKTCAGRCGKVKNNCKKTVDCGPCDCDPPCGACATCTDALVCAPCSPCCDEVCCAQTKAVCHRDTGECCVPESHAQTCDNQCGDVVNNCGLTVNCGACTCGEGCAFCRICDEATGECVPDPHDVGEPCGAATCADGIVTDAPTCDASGACQPGAQTSCTPYARCDGDACATTCGNTADCRDGFFCDDTDHCVAQGDPGEPCDEAAQCLSGFCADAVCCDTACNGDCEACNLSGSVGTCTTEADGTGCGGGNVCCSGACQECCDGGECSGNTPICDEGVCAECSVDPAGCPGDTCCNADSGECVGACPAADPVCGADTVCVPCSGTDPCPTGQCCTGDGTCGACLVFVSSSTSNGNLGGLDGAHQRCQTLAEAANLPGAYKAWISDGGVAAPVDFFTKATVPYRRTDGETIANNWDDLKDGTLAVPIDRDENGTPVATSIVWTNTNDNGTVVGMGDCENWQGTGDNTSVGESDKTSSFWSTGVQESCANTGGRLYCFQQT